jgi:GDP-4-dehydro-6-deoxy-D-mannose reductase
MPRALVTGASGFIGRHIATELAARGWHVVKAVRRLTNQLSPETLVLGQDPWDTGTFASAIAEAAPDVVFHMAGTMWPESVAQFYAVNVLMTARLLEAVAASSTRPAVVLAGSAAEYGHVSEQQQPVREDAPCTPLNHYGISKYAQTMLGLAYARAGCSVLIARIFNPVGLGMPTRLALASFAEQLRTADNVLVTGDLDVARDFIDVVEVARLMVALASRSDNYGQVFNICSGMSFHLRPLVEEMIRLTGRQIRLSVSPARLRPDDMRVFRGDIALLHAAGLCVDPPDFSVILPALLAN